MSPTAAINIQAIPTPIMWLENLPPGTRVTEEGEVRITEEEELRVVEPD